MELALRVQPRAVSAAPGHLSLIHEVYAQDCLEDPEWVHCLAPIYPAVGIGKVKLQMTRAASLLLLVNLARDRDHVEGEPATRTRTNGSGRSVRCLRYDFCNGRAT
jgi:hypothetical protein